MVGLFWDTAHKYWREVALSVRLSPMKNVEISLNEAGSRFEATQDSQVVGVLEFTMQGDTMVLTSTEVDPGHGGKGIGGQLVQFAMESARESGDTQIAPSCPFVVSWVERHPGYRDLVVPVPEETTEAEETEEAK